jgi:hypothetical protein
MTVFGTLRQTPQNPGVYAWDGVPKPVPKSKFQNLANFMSFGTFVTTYRYEAYSPNVVEWDFSEVRHESSAS